MYNYCDQCNVIYLMRELLRGHLLLLKFVLINRNR